MPGSRLPTNAVSRHAALAEGTITPAHLSPGMRDAAVATDPGERPLREAVEELERCMIKDTLARTGGNKTRAAEILGLSRLGLRKKIERYGLSAER